jgi:hypothetical protein
MGTADLIDWANEGIYTCGRALLDFQRQRNLDFAYDAQKSMRLTNWIIDELVRRQELSTAGRGPALDLPDPDAFRAFLRGRAGGVDFPVGVPES